MKARFVFSKLHFCFYRFAVPFSVVGDFSCIVSFPRFLGLISLFVCVFSCCLESNELESVLLHVRVFVGVVSEHVVL